MTYFDTKSNATLEATEFKFPEDKGVSVYPNPTNGVFTVDSKYNLEDAVIKIFNMEGVELYSSDRIPNFNGPFTLDANNLVSNSNRLYLAMGTYLLRIEAKNFRSTKQLIITR